MLVGVRISMEAQEVNWPFDLGSSIDIGIAIDDKLRGIVRKY